jgi:hypothetical protein
MFSVIAVPVFLFDAQDNYGITVHYNKTDNRFAVLRSENLRVISVQNIPETLVCQRIAGHRFTVDLVQITDRIFFVHGITSPFVVF